MTASVANHGDMVELLVASKANIHQCIRRKRVSPLIVAAASNSMEVVAALISYRANVLHRSANGECALDIATCSGFRQVAKILRRECQRKLTSKLKRDLPTQLEKGVHDMIFVAMHPSEARWASVRNTVDTECEGDPIKYHLKRKRQRMSGLGESYDEHIYWKYRQD